MAEWLEHMPWIPLARGVPVKVRFITGWEDGIVLDPTGGRGGEPLVDVGYDRVSTYSSETPIRFRVDLDDPQGFAYALRYATRHHHDPSVLRNREIGPERWLHDKPCDAERLDLARTLQEVNHAKALKEVSQ